MIEALLYQDIYRETVYSMTALSIASSNARHNISLASLLILVLLLITATPSWAFGSSNSLFGGQSSQFLPVDEALPFSHTTDDNAIVLFWDITPKHYLYRDRISIKALDEGTTAGAPIYSSPGIETEDEYFGKTTVFRSEEHTSELQSRPHLVCRLLLEKKKT